MPDNRIGFEVDPYDTPGERAEIFQMHGRVYYDGPFSTWREIHIGIRGFAAGLRAGELSQVPECPPLWTDEGQYWDGCAMIANVAKIKGSAIIATLLGAYAYLKTQGVL